jgi:hypothetical protein
VTIACYYYYLIGLCHTFYNAIIFLKKIFVIYIGILCCTLLFFSRQKSQIAFQFARGPNYFRFPVEDLRFCFHFMKYYLRFASSPETILEILQELYVSI